MPTVAEVDAMDEAAFVAVLGHVYEDSPHLAAAAWSRRPFGSRDALVAAFVAVADELDDDAVLVLLRAHPQLAADRPMAAASVSEQRGAGLRDLDAEARARITAGNAAYLDRFGFPFIIAVKGLGPADVAAAMDARLGNDAAVERATALTQVQRIAALRIEDAVAP